MATQKFDVVLSIPRDSPYFSFLKDTYDGCAVVSKNGTELLHISCDEVNLGHSHFAELVVVCDAKPRSRQRLRIPYSSILLILDPAEDVKEIGFKK